MRAKKDLLKSILKAARDLRDSNEDPTDLYSYLYMPHKDLKAYLDNLKSKIESQSNPTCSREEKVKIGYLMEQIAFLCFQGLEGITSINMHTGESPSLVFLCLRIRKIISLLP